MLTNCFEVVPLTIESSTSTIDFPFNTLLRGFNFIFTPSSLSSWVGFINVLPTYLFLTNASVSGSPLAFAYPKLKEDLKTYRQEMAQKVLDDDKSINQ